MKAKSGLSTAELRALSALRRAGREAVKATYAARRAERATTEEGRQRATEEARRASDRAHVERERAAAWHSRSPEAARAQAEAQEASQEGPEAAQEAPEAPEAPEASQEGPEAPEASQEGPGDAPEAAPRDEPWTETWGDWIQHGPQDGAQRPPDSLFEPATSRYGESKAMRPETIATGDYGDLKAGLERIQRDIGHGMMAPGGSLYLPNGEAIKVPTEVAAAGPDAVAEWVEDEIVSYYERMGEDYDDSDDVDWRYEVDELRYVY